ncbi:MAG: hypothetical protein AAB495_04075 [Patescibacteria group bacterium]
MFDFDYGPGRRGSLSTGVLGTEDRGGSDVLDLLRKMTEFATAYVAQKTEEIRKQITSYGFRFTETVFLGFRLELEEGSPTVVIAAKTGCLDPRHFAEADPSKISDPTDLWELWLTSFHLPLEDVIRQINSSPIDPATTPSS